MSYLTEVLADSPIAYWRLDTTTGTETDLGSGGHTLTYVGTVTRGTSSLLPADSDLSATYPGGANYCSTPNVPDLRFTTGPWAVEAWVQATAYTGFQTIQQMGSGGGLGYIFGTQDDELRITIPSVTDVVSTQVNLTGRHHVAAQFRTDRNIEFYKDGALVQIVTNASLPLTNTSSTIAKIGSNAADTETWTGKIDEVALYATGINSSRLMAHYLTGAGLIPSDRAPLIAGWGAA